MASPVNGSLHQQSFPNESAEYRQKRDALLAEEIALRRQMESVAEHRRALPPGGAIPTDYVFEEGAEALEVAMSSLFGDKDTLVAYSFMYGPNVERPCPSCTSILDSLDGAVSPVSQRVSLVVIAKSPIARILDFARERGWRNLRLLSSAANSYNSDYHGEDSKGSQWPMLNVFTRRDHVIRHAYGTELLFAAKEPGQDGRHVDPIWPLWNVLDYTPVGRGDFHPRLAYS
jgi:predicted dithiol-disulfide oxidoreductase (DUF899 family)